MPFGRKAKSADTPYHVYEYAVNGRVFYVGISWSDVRSHGRWDHVKNLVRHELAGTLKPSKAKDLGRKSNQVIAAMIRSGQAQHEVRICWRGLGRDAADQVETRRISELVDAGSVLANDAKNRRRATVAEVLRYLEGAHDA